jgi:hypothetical protein
MKMTKVISVINEIMAFYHAKGGFAWPLSLRSVAG